MKSILLLLYLTISISNLCAMDVFDTSKNQFINYNDFIQQIPSVGDIVLGEYHYSESIQLMEAKIIEDLATFNNHISVSWEFLNYTEQSNINFAIQKYRNNQINVNALIFELFPGISSDLFEKTKKYIPIFDIITTFDIPFYGVNLPRKYKQLVRESGLDAIDGHLIPPEFQMGSSNYKNRFFNFMRDGMGGHATPEIIKGFYLAQCLTDSVIANRIGDLHYDLNILIIGSFHSDYNDGTILQLNRYSSRPIVNIKIVDSNDMSEDEISQLITPSTEYGIIADFIVII